VIFEWRGLFFISGAKEHRQNMASSPATESPANQDHLYLRRTVPRRFVGQSVEPTLGNLVLKLLVPETCIELDKPISKGRQSLRRQRATR
jgi:hypothetical protein